MNDITPNTHSNDTIHTVGTAERNDATTQAHGASTTLVDKVKAVKARDDAREGIPGEHWLTLAAGVGVWLATRRHRSVVVNGLGLVAATALAARAASGRDGLAKVLRYTPLGGGIRRM